MGQPIQSKTRTEIREDIGDNLQDMRLVEATSTIDTSSLIATYSLAKGGDNEYNGRQVVLVTKVGSIVLGERSWIAGFASSTFDATVAPTFTASITDGDIFEMWRIFTYEEINRAINQAISHATNDALQIKTLETTFTQANIFQYNVLSSFVALYKVEYESKTGQQQVIDDCEIVWDELVDGDVTATRDTTIVMEGSASLKLVVAAGAGPADILATNNLSEADISQHDQLAIWVYSTTALDAGDLQVLLDDTAQCASPTESLDIPATAANTKTRHIISLADPTADSAIISVGIKMVVDKGAFTVYVDGIKTQNSASIEFTELNTEQWKLVKGSNKLTLTQSGLGVTGIGKQLRLTGYRIPALMTADTDTCEIDPDWVVARVTGRLLVSHAKSPRLDIKDKERLSRYWLGEAAALLPSITTQMLPNTRYVK